MRTVRSGSALLRLIVFLLSTRLGLLIVGVVLIVVGIVYGVNSHAVKYQTVDTGIIAHYLSGDVSQDANGYLQLAGNTTLYIVPQSHFNPIVDGTNTFSDGDTISLVYRTDYTTSISKTASNTGTQLQGNAYTVEKITLFSTRSQQVFVSDDYTQHPTNYYINNWPLGGILLGLGALVAALALFVPLLFKKKPKESAAGSIAASMANAAGDAQIANPYQQPYQGPAQYQQYQQSEVYLPNSTYNDQSSLSDARPT